MEILSRDCRVWGDMVPNVPKLNAETKLVLLFSLLLWGLALGVRCILFIVRGGENWSMPLTLVGLLAVVLFLLWLVAKNLRSLPLITIIVVGPIVAMLADMVHTELYFLTTTQSFSWVTRDFNLRNYTYETYLASLFYLTWYLGYFAIINYHKFVKETLAVSEARTQAHQTELQMLRYQINPHFLFNTLNSISTLVLDTGNEKAEQMLGNLSRFLRFSLDKNPEEKVSLQEEIAIVKEYLGIEKIRYADKLTTTFDLASDTLDCLVPSLLLQPAIENAIKHAIAPSKSTGEINISSKISGDILEICISDNGLGLSLEKNPDGVGVKNMRKRLDVMYEGHGSLMIRNGDFSGVDVLITLPVERLAEQKVGVAE